ncbi:MAG: DNA polymerase III subunit gamma and tau [Nigerium sp.]|nr:DNA polymerase III subunit gamma and tau [Nigerium sp.]
MFDDEGSFAAEPPDPFAQDGPDLFGTEPDELILPAEPVPVDDPEMEIDLDEMSEIPIDPDEPDASAEPPEAIVPVRTPAASTPLPPPSAPRRAPQLNRPDAPLALYRRYRPDTFAEVIGQEHVTDPLQRALTNNKVSHAYLFSGPRGCGKTTSARILARCLNCEQGPTPNPCGACQSCRDLARGGGGSIDVIEIDAASHGGVDEARDLRERAFFAPVHSRYKIYIIDEAHMVTNAGFNALLKVVEEPPAHVKFIFATTEPEKVIGTIRSRTHHYPFRLVPPRTLTAYLAQLCAAEGVTVDPAVLPLVVRAGAGSVRDSLSVLDQLLGGAAEGGVSYRQATRLLGYTPDSLLDEVMDAFAAGDAKGVFACIDKVVEVGQDPRRFAEDLLRRLRDLIIVAAVPDAMTSGLVDVAGDQAERLTTQASAMGPGELTRAAEVIAKGLTDMRGTTAPRLYLELMGARVLLPGADVGGRGVHARLDRLERRLQMASGDPAAPATERIERAGPDAPHPTQPGQPQPGQQRPRPEARATQAAVADPWPGTPASQAVAEPWSGPPAHETVASEPAHTAPPTSRRAPASRPTVREEPPRAASRAATAPGPTLSTAQVRAEWPSVLERVKGRRRVTWIVVRENAIVHDYRDEVLTLAFSNPGARESFARGGHDAILREVLREAFGVTATVRTVDDADAPAPDAVAPSDPAAAAPREGTPPGHAAGHRGGVDPREYAPPGGDEPHAAHPPAAAPRPEVAADAARAIAQARANVQPTRSGRAGEDDDAGESLDDLDLDQGVTDVDDLLVTKLGAELIGDEEQ